MEFIAIFTEMNWVPALLLIVGAVLLLVETFVPGFGFFGISGICSLVAGVIVRICQGLNVTQAMGLILIIIGFFVVCALYMVFSAQFGILGRTGLFETKATISKDYNVASKQLRKLVGKSGKAVTNLSLAGKAKINGKIYDVISMNSYIEKGSNIKVVEISDNNIVVRKWFE